MGGGLVDWWDGARLVSGLWGEYLRSRDCELLARVHRLEKDGQVSRAHYHGEDLPEWLRFELRSSACCLYELNAPKVLLLFMCMLCM